MQYIYFFHKQGKYFLSLVTASLLIMISPFVYSDGVIPSLKNMEIPPVPGLFDGDAPIVIDKQKAILLGKALFWDMNVGSDGVACASCHFHAGADRRVKNQLNPGTKSNAPSGETFDVRKSGVQSGPNYTVTSNDFPFHQFQNPFHKPGNFFGIDSPVIASSDDAMTSSGTFSGEFKGAKRTGSGVEDCTRSFDPIFSVGGVNTRRVEPRNAPNVINAVFNHRNFWDGRANNVFNGSSNWGDRDPDAGVWVKISGGKVEKQRLHLINSSLASQALATIFSDTEMVCRDRTIADLGRKLLMRRPLDSQKVHPEDSVLGALSLSSAGDLQPGLNTTYRTLVKQAFNNKYWSYYRRGKFGRPAKGVSYSQMEANFGLFFGLALQVYESTLVSDDAKIDQGTRDTAHVPDNFTQDERDGLAIFTGVHCVFCHFGPLLTGAAQEANISMLRNFPEEFGPPNPEIPITQSVISREGFFKGSAMHDVGFINTGVADESNDPGLGALDDFGNPLSFAEQYIDRLVGNLGGVLDPSVSKVRACDFKAPLALNQEKDVAANVFSSLDGLVLDSETTNCFLSSAPGLFKPSNYIPTPTVALAELTNSDPITAKMLTSVNGAFKVPSLRNIELTGPYMHNGSMATLDHVLEFYARGGNFESPNVNGFMSGLPAILDTPSQDRSLIRAKLIAFLKTLTDDRVKYQRAPFDHPELTVFSGHVGDELNVADDNPINASLAKDEVLVIPAVGATGTVEPLQPFDTFLEQ